MPQGIVKKLVHLTSQSARLENTSLFPTRNGVGFGYIAGEGETLYFEPGAVEGGLRELQVGQAVEYDRDAGVAVASRVVPLAGGPGAPPASFAAPSRIPPSRAPLKADAVAKKGAAKKKGEDEGSLVIEDKRQCLVVSRYEKTSDHVWRRVGRVPEIETYASPVADDYAEPLITRLSPTRCVARVFDEKAVDMNHPANFLGDWAGAQARCDRALLDEFPGDQLQTEAPAAAKW